MSSIVRRLKYATLHTSLRVRRDHLSRRGLFRIFRDGIGNECFLVDPDGEDVKVRDTDADKELILIEIRTDDEVRICLLGKDDHCFVSRLPRNIYGIEHALRYFMPEAVVRAKNRGLKVKRQGDWYFVPVVSLEMIRELDRRSGERPLGEPWDAFNHRCDTCVRRDDDVYVKGKVTHPEHSDLNLAEWHWVRRNNSLRSRDRGAGWRGLD